VTIGERSLKEGVVEYQGRRDKEARKLRREEALAILKATPG